MSSSLPTPPISSSSTLRERLNEALPKYYDGYVHAVSDYDDDAQPLIAILQHLPDDLEEQVVEWLWEEIHKLEERRDNAENLTVRTILNVRIDTIMALLRSLKD